MSEFVSIHPLKTLTIDQLHMIDVNNDQYISTEEMSEFAVENGIFDLEGSVADENGNGVDDVWDEVLGFTDIEKGWTTWISSDPLQYMDSEVFSRLFIKDKGHDLISIDKLEDYLVDSDHYRYIGVPNIIEIREFGNVLIDRFLKNNYLI